MVLIPPIYGDEWGIVYYCYTNIIGVYLFKTIGRNHLSAATGSGSINWTTMADPGDGPMEKIFRPGRFGSDHQSHSPLVPGFMHLARIRTEGIKDAKLGK